MTATRQNPQESHLTASELGIHPGDVVMSADNKRLGDVSETRGRYFKVHRRLAADYWIDLQDVVGVFQDQIIVEFSKDTAGQHQVPANIVNDERMDARADHLLNETEMNEQRARMERELNK